MIYLIIFTLLVLLIFGIYVLALFFFDIASLIVSLPLLFYFGNRLIGGLKKDDRQKEYGTAMVFALPIFAIPFHWIILVGFFCTCAWCIGQLILIYRQDKPIPLAYHLKRIQKILPILPHKQIDFEKARDHYELARVNTELAH